MSDDNLPVLGAEDLVRLARQRAAVPCPACAPLVCPGWEALSATFERDHLQRVGTLRRPDDEDPTLAEYHPGGTNAWSPQAPIAPAWYPYNRSDVWVCRHCARPFLRYTEFGGYYVEERIREVTAARVTIAPR